MGSSTHLLKNTRTSIEPGESGNESIRIDPGIRTIKKSCMRDVPEAVTGINCHFLRYFSLKTYSNLVKEVEKRFHGASIFSGAGLSFTESKW